MKNKKFIALMLGITFCIGVFSGCGANNTTATDNAELEQQIKAYLDANLDSYLDNYFDYGGDWGDSEQEPDRTQFSNLKAFTAKTLDGGTFTQEDIAAKDVTVINFWSLLCGYCIDELPDIAKYAATLPDNVQVITVCLGLDGEAEIEAAKSTLQEAGFSGIALMEGDGDFATVCDEVQYTPTTIFVDKDGNTVGDAIISALDANQMTEVYTQHINEVLKAIGQPELKK
ncbi:MAG: TlpA family protein disulfide reductase [Lachnospiraceae bacterium]|nr:TlpA family protein disulfide reductase [Lachnospiraceae bacterium]